ncbi:MAG TPA: hypothetical protein VF456_17930 [Vicinamibacterales bacterium]
MHTASARWLAAFLALSGCATGFVNFPLRDEAVATEDLNRDGQPDVWRVHDEHGRLTEIVRDSNFDGRPDVREYYDRGVLVRRESDRNFNNQIDLIEVFDAVTGQHVRSVLDLDDDGTADLLVLFQSTHIAFVKRASRNGLAARGHAGEAPGVGTRLLPLDDPFLGDLAVRPGRAPAEPSSVLDLSITGGLPATSRTVVCLLVPESKVPRGALDLIGTKEFGAGSPRGPPPLSLNPNHV